MGKPVVGILGFSYQGGVSRIKQPSTLKASPMCECKFLYGGGPGFMGTGVEVQLSCFGGIFKK
jgi:hypothetical protein